MVEDEEADPVADGVDHDEEMDVWAMKRYGKNEIGSDGYRVLDSEGGNPAMEQPLDQGVSKVKIECPHCDRENTVRLPPHLTVTRASRTGEGDGGQDKLLRTKCGHCGETVRFHAGEGFAFTKRESAASSRESLCTQAQCSRIDTNS